MEMSKATAKTKKLIKNLAREENNNNAGKPKRRQTKMPTGDLLRMQLTSNKPRTHDIYQSRHPNSPGHKMNNTKPKMARITERQMRWKLHRRHPNQEDKLLDSMNTESGPRFLTINMTLVRDKVKGMDSSAKKRKQHPKTQLSELEKRINDVPSDRNKRRRMRKYNKKCNQLWKQRVLLKWD